MIRVSSVWFFIIIISAGNSLHGSNYIKYGTAASPYYEQDTLKEHQDLYNGRMWVNKFRRIDDNQFLFSNYFLPGTVSANGKTFRNLSIRYDIFLDEIMIPVNREDILQVNKEMVDSFTINFENKEYRFLKVSEDTLNGLKDFRGYLCVLYKQRSSLYIKYKKTISPHVEEKSDGEFIPVNKVFFVKDKKVYPITGTNDLYKALNADKKLISSYLKSNKLKISKNKPESYIPVIRFYDNKRQ